MTNVTPARIAAANLGRITADLAEAQADVDLLERLKSAGDRLKRLTAEHDKATSDHKKAVAAEAKVAKANRFKGITDIRVTESAKSIGENVIRSHWTIHYTRPSWDMWTQRSDPREHSVGGFGMLPPEVMDCLIENYPHQIPAKIMALATDQPREAFRRYFLAQRRGFVAG